MEFLVTFHSDTENHNEQCHPGMMNVYSRSATVKLKMSSLKICKQPLRIAKNSDMYFTMTHTVKHRIT